MSCERRKRNPFPNLAKRRRAEAWPVDVDADVNAESDVDIEGKFISVR